MLKITVRPFQDTGRDAGDVGNDNDADTVAQSANEAASVDAESALFEQHQVRQVAEARAIVAELAPPPEPAPQPSTSKPAAEAATGGDTFEAAAERSRRGVRSPARAQQPPAETTLAPIVRDVAHGMVEAPRQILGGARDAVQAAINLGDWLADNLEAVAPLGGIQLFDTAGNFAPEFVPGGDPRLAPDMTGVTLPDVRQAETTTGGLVRSVSQFLTSFFAAGPTANAVIKGGGIIKSSVQGALADFIGFEGHEANLAKLLRDHAGLADPVTAFLATDPADNEALNRLRRSIEGLGLGVAAEGLVRALRYMRDARRARTATPQEQVAREQATAVPEAQPLTLLGDEAAPLISRGAAPEVVRPAAGRPALDAGVPDDVVARSLTPEGLTAPVAAFRPGEGFRPVMGAGDDAVYVNWSRIESEADVQRVMADMIRAFPDDIAAARRVVRKDADVQAEAARTGAFDALIARRTGEPLSDTQTLAARALWEGAAEHLMDTAAAATRAGTPEAHAQMYRMIDIYRGIQAMVLGARADAARSLRAWGVETGQSGADRLRAIGNLIDTHGGPDVAADMAQRLAAVRNLPELQGDLARFLEKSAFAKSVATVKQAWVNFLLSSPLTHVRNIVGNSAAMTFGLVERVAARGYSQALGTGQVQAGEAAALAFGQIMAIRQGLRLAAQTVRAGESQFARTQTKVAEVGFEQPISAQYWKLHSESPAGRAVDALGTVINTPTRLLLAEDDFFKAVAYQGEVATQAHRQAQREVASRALEREQINERVAQLIADPPEHIKMAGMNAAHYQTFTDKPGKFVQAVNRLDREWSSSDNPGAQVAALAMRFLIPFRNTPARLMNYTFERTPLAPLTNTYREAIAQGGAAADIAKARMALGSFVLLGMMDLAFEGRINGAGPSARKGDERGTRQTAQQSGWLPYSVRIGDRYFSFANLDPGGTAFGIAADLAEIIMNADLDDETQRGVHDVFAGAVFAFAGQVLDKTWMQGASSAINTLSRDQTAGRFVTRIEASVLSPNIFPYLRRQVDPTMRMSHDLVTRLRDRLPGLSSTLPPIRDQWGRERTYQTGLGQVYDAVSPVLSRRFDPEPIDRDALRYGFNLSMPNRTLRYQGQWYPTEHHPEVYSRYVELQGQARPSEMGDVRGAGALRRRDMTPAKLLVAKYGDMALLPLLNEIVEGRHALSAEYRRRDATAKDRMITTIVTDYRRAARERLFEEFPDLVARTRSYNWRFPGIEPTEDEDAVVNAD